MRIKVSEVIPQLSTRYPYTHRVEVDGDALAADKVTAWLKESEIHYCGMGWGVYYLDSKATNMLVLRWS